MIFLKKTILGIVQAIRLSKFCFIFTLRQGTIMIASVELSLSTFAMILLLLCLTHANHLVDMVSADIEQFEKRIWYQKGDTETPTYIFDNEKKMLTGQHLALILRVAVSVLLFATIVYFISSILLLHGAIRKSPDLLLPWTSVVFISLVTVLFWFLPFCYFILCNFCIATCTIFFIIYPLQIYAWLTVFSYYQQLSDKQFNKTDNSYKVDKIYPPQIIETCK